MDKEPIVLHPDDEDDHEALKVKKRLGFNDQQVQNLAKLQVGFGSLVILLGIFIEIASFYIRCDKYCYGIYVSQIGTGIWCGVVFIVTGYIGLLAATRKTTCFLVTLLTLSVCALTIAALQTTLAIVTMATDKERILVEQNSSPSKDGKWDDFSDSIKHRIPVTVFVLNLVLAVFGLVLIGLLLATAIYSCMTLCCDASPTYLKLNLYEPVVMPTTYSNQTQMQPFVMPGGQVYYASPGYGGLSSRMQPIILIPSNQQFSMQPTTSFENQTAYFQQQETHPSSQLSSSGQVQGNSTAPSNQP